MNKRPHLSDLENCQITARKAYIQAEKSLTIEIGATLALGFCATFSMIASTPVATAAIGLLLGATGIKMLYSVNQFQKSKTHLNLLKDQKLSLQSNEQTLFYIIKAVRENKSIPQERLSKLRAKPPSNSL